MPNIINNKKIIIFLLILGISIGFASLATRLNINGFTLVTKQRWDIHFENVRVVDGSVDASSPSINSSRDTVNFTVDLIKPGDYFEFLVDAKNDGTVDGMIDTISNLILDNNGDTIKLPDCLEYIVTYEDDIEIEEKHLLGVDNKETYKVRVKYKDSVLADSNLNIHFEFSVKYVPADISAKKIKRAICVRATSLHTEECLNTSTGCYLLGYYEGGAMNTATITYGQLGESGILTPGDAFDCDVNDDGKYDPETERFYYVSKKDVDPSSEYATLIYYNNVSGGIPDVSSSYAYGSIAKGPVALAEQLPTTAQWSNDKLVTNMVRNIKYRFGSIACENFSYTNKAARLLTIFEVMDACKLTKHDETGELDSCIYFMENTGFSTKDQQNLKVWLESPESNSKGNYILANYRKIYSYSSSTRGGVRPAIEVLLDDIKY